MKINPATHLGTLGLILGVFTLLGCNKGGKLSEHSVSKPPSGPVELKLKWPMGERVEQEMTMTMKSEMNIPGRGPMLQDMTMGQNYGLTVLQANPDGTHEIEMDFLSSRMTMTMGGKSMIDFDSSKPKSKPAGKTDSPADVFGKIVGSKIRYFLDSSNTVDHIEGVDDLLQKMSPSDNEQQAAAYKGVFNDGYFKQLMSASAILPHNAVQPGDTWPVRLEIALGVMGTLVMDFNYTFADWEMHGARNCARLDFQGTISEKAAPTSGPMKISIQDGTTSGSCWFDPELGIVIDNKMTQNMKMVIQMTQPGKNSSRPLTFTNQMEQAISIKLLSVK